MTALASPAHAYRRPVVFQQVQPRASDADSFVMKRSDSRPTIEQLIDCLKVGHDQLSEESRCALFQRVVRELGKDSHAVLHFAIQYLQNKDWAWQKSPGHPRDDLSCAARLVLQQLGRYSDKQLAPLQSDLYACINNKDLFYDTYFELREYIFELRRPWWQRLYDRLIGA